MNSKQVKEYLRTTGDKFDKSSDYEYIKDDHLKTSGGCYKNVLICDDKVLKTARSGEKANMREEVELGQIAVERGFGDVFLPLTQEFEWNEQIFYSQEKVDCIATNKDYNLDLYKIELEFPFLSTECMEFSIDAYNYYGEERYKKILEFIKEFRIYDLHTSNIGYIGERPVIFDYMRASEDDWITSLDGTVMHLTINQDRCSVCQVFEIYDSQNIEKK